MKFIVKQSEPKEWRDYKKTPGVEFQAIPELKTALLTEQGYLCCYCMSQITFDKMKVEHYRPRRFENLILEYTNLLAACTGNYCSEKHCDTRKENEDLTINPTDPKNNCENLIGYSSNGKLSYPKEYTKDIEEILNLNNTVLVANRKSAIYGAALVVQKAKYNKAFIYKMIQTYSNKDDHSKYKPYCNAILWLLRKRLTAN